jgi:hypothetical protein
MTAVIVVILSVAKNQFYQSIPLTPFRCERKGEVKREGLTPLSLAHSLGISAFLFH